MPARKTPHSGPPPYYVATEDLYVYNPGSGAMPVCAEREGGKVAADVVAANNWGDKVRVPDEFAPAKPVANAAGKE